MSICGVYVVCCVTSDKLVSSESGKAREGETSVAIQKTYEKPFL